MLARKATVILLSEKLQKEGEIKDVDNSKLQKMLKRPESSNYSKKTFWKTNKRNFRFY